MSPRPRRTQAFTLIEIMAVVLIIGLLGGIVGVVIFGQVDSARVTTARTQIKQIESALEFYRLDNGRYPTTEEGLEALVDPTRLKKPPKRYPNGGYHRRPNFDDPWGHPYQYLYPGTNTEIDVWSYGADSEPGGEHHAADIGTWNLHL